MDEESSVSHEKLAQETEEAFGDPKKLGLNVCMALTGPSQAGLPPGCRLGAASGG